MRLFVLAFLAASVAAFSTSFNVSVSQAGDLVFVKGDFAFANVIPGQDYERRLDVEMKVPESALSGIVAKSLVLHVVAESNSAKPWVYFVEGGKNFKTLSFDLACVIENNSCSKKSNLTKSLVAGMHAPLNASYPHSEKIIVSANFNEPRESIPAATFSEVTQAVKTVKEKVAGVKNESVAQEVLRKLGTAQGQADSGNYAEALEVVAAAEKKVEETREPFYASLVDASSVSEAVDGITAMVTTNSFVTVGVVFVVALAGYAALSRFKKKHSDG